MNKGKFLTEKLHYLKQLEAYLGQRDLEIDSAALLDYLSSKLNSEPLLLKHVSELAYQIAYTDELFSKNELQEHQRADLFNILSNLIFELEDLVRRDGLSPALYRFSFQYVGKQGIVFEVVPYAAKL